MKEYLLDEAAVFIAGTHYDIIWNTTQKGLAWVEVAVVKYYDEQNGMIKSEETVHKVSVPQKALDKAKCYTIFFHEVFDRKPYFPTSSDEIFSKSYDFRPVSEKKEKLCFYMISDTHNEDRFAVKAAEKYKEKLDFLMLCGDVQNDSESFDCIRTVFRVCAGVTKGNIPVVSARGNHDTRGQCAPDYHKYTATENGEVFFTFTLGSLFGIVLDCGEDKPDNHPEYGGMNVFEPYRQKVTEFLRETAEKGEYAKHRHVMVFCHERTDAHNHTPFKEIYGEWTRLINSIKPQLMVCGHEHVTCVFPKGRKFFDTDLTFEFDTVVGSQCRGNKRTGYADLPQGFTGSYFEISEKDIKCSFTDDMGNVEESHVFTL